MIYIKIQLENSFEKKNMINIYTFVKLVNKKLICIALDTL